MEREGIMFNTTFFKRVAAHLPYSSDDSLEPNSRVNATYGKGNKFNEHAPSDDRQPCRSDSKWVRHFER